MYKMKLHPHKGDLGRTCVRWGTPMTNSYNIPAFNLERSKIFESKTKHIKSVVCPKCGEISLYTDELDDLFDE